MSLNRGILFNFISRFGGALANLAISILISRELGAEVKGSHALFIAGVAMLQLPAGWFGSAALVYLTPRHDHRKLLYISNNWVLLCMIPLWTVLRYFDIIPVDISIELLIASISFGWWNNYSHILLGREENKAFNLLQFLHPISTLLLTVALFWIQEPSLAAFAKAYLISQLINLVTAGVLVHKKGLQESSDSYANLIGVMRRHGFFLQLANLTQFLNYRILYFFVDFYFGKQVLGVYSNAQSLVEAVWMVTRSISTIQFGRIANSSDDKANRDLTRKYAFISLVVSFVCIVPLIVLPSDFFTTLFGKDFSGLSEYIYLIAPAILAMSMGNIYAHYFAGSGRNLVNFTGSFINLCSTLLCFFLLKDTFGVHTAPVVSSISFGLHLFFHLGYFRFGPASK
ncbi:MAG: hypothetical protein EP332_06005 [Bacteroidetes bacterium]|nr:MAG: hypothetical protein EP332_06005 [Bacteroidota bacterium]